MKYCYKVICKVIIIKTNENLRKLKCRKIRIITYITINKDDQNYNA